MERRPFEFQIRDREQYDNLSGSLVSNVPLSCWTMAEGGERGREGETVERNEEDGVYRAIVARLIQFFFFTAEEKGGRRRKLVHHTPLLF